MLDWEYTTDDVGNPTLIDDLVGSPDRSYAYQPHQYFLTDAAGPWPGPLEWTYDRIGNRLSEDRNSVVDTYDYTGSPGNTALLSAVTLGVGGTRAYDYTTAGHVTEVDAGANVVDFLVDEEGRLGGLERVAGDAGSSMLYDGRGFLSRVEGFELSTIFRDGFERETTECWSDGVPTPPSPGSPCSSAFRIVEPVYDSAGLLHALGVTETLLGSSTERVLYLAGRPVAIAKGDVGALGLLYLTTDHLGTPIAACDDTGTLQWSGGFEPFGTDWLAGTAGGASENGVWLRFPGQWVDSAWEADAGTSSLYQNVFRWYLHGLGRFGTPDPLVRETAEWYGYATQRPLVLVDSLGLYVTIGSPDQQSRVRDAMKTIKDQLTDDDNTGGCLTCSEYFEERGVNLFDWLKEGTTRPVIQFRDLGPCTERNGTRAGGTGKPPFVTFFVNPKCFNRPITACELAGTLLHEMGHLARQDTHDNEPPDFFKICQFGCVNPGAGK